MRGRLIQTARAALDGLDYPAGQVALLQARAMHGFAVGDLETVRAVAEEGADLARADGDLYSLEMMALNLGTARLIAGDLDAARPALSEALRVAREIDDRVSQAYLLVGLACHAAMSSQAPLAARLLGAADEVRAGPGITLLPQFAPLVPVTSELAVAALGASRFTAGVAAGRELTRDRAIRLALGEPASTGPDGQGGAARSPLSPRETEIAGLVADGLTNKQIGTRLFLSERTIDSHVRSILTKLGAGSRAQIATWVTASDH
jgi:DNA-binding CsgD family transcriptional regulator